MTMQGLKSGGTKEFSSTMISKQKP